MADEQQSTEESLSPDVDSLLELARNDAREAGYVDDDPGAAAAAVSQQDPSTGATAAAGDSEEPEEAAAESEEEAESLAEEPDEPEPRKPTPAEWKAFREQKKAFKAQRDQMQQMQAQLQAEREQWKTERERQSRSVLDAIRSGQNVDDALKGVLGMGFQDLAKEHLASVQNMDPAQRAAMEKLQAIEKRLEEKEKAEQARAAQWQQQQQAQAVRAEIQATLKSSETLSAAAEHPDFVSAVYQRAGQHVHEYGDAPDFEELGQEVLEAWRKRHDEIGAILGVRAPTDATQQPGSERGGKNPGSEQSGRTSGKGKRNGAPPKPLTSQAAVGSGNPAPPNDIDSIVAEFGPQLAQAAKSEFAR